MKYIKPTTMVPKVRRHNNNITKALAGFIFGLLMLQIIVSNRLATTGLVIAKTDGDIKILSSENADLRQQVASFSALTNIQTTASSFGFTQPIVPHYFAKEPDVALDIH